MIIRIAQPMEVNIIHSYAKQVQEEATLGYIKQSDYDPNKEAYFSGNCYYLVLINNGVLNGWILVSETYASYTNEPCGMILELYVFPKYRKNGYGHELMKHALDNLKKRGFQKVHLNVFAGNSAFKLYKKMGFKEVSTVMEKKL